MSTDDIIGEEQRKLTTKDIEPNSSDVKIK